MIRRIASILALLLVVSLIGVSKAPSANASSKGWGGCHGASCVGLDPTSRCDGDAITVASMAVPSTSGGYAGQLDLRYSRSCEANWGRFTPYNRNMLGALIGAPTPIYGRVTVWNPGQPSQPGINGRNLARTLGSEWTYMVDGRTRACTGVEVLDWEKNPYADGDPEDPVEGNSNQVPGGGGFDSEGWTWGPCV